jgi:phosphatidylserine decarboxylase
VSPADGTVVYAEVVEPHAPAIAIKQGMTVCINDIVREDLARPRLLIGIFMSPFDVHYNRAPLTGTVEFVRHYPAITKNVHMTFMHLRTLLNLFPFYRHSVHIVENERTVTRITGEFKGRPLSSYVVQIAGGTVSGIDSYVRESQVVEKGEIFGMIRIGSQVDLVVPYRENMRITVGPGVTVKAGESILVE